MIPILNTIAFNPRIKGIEEVARPNSKHESFVRPKQHWDLNPRENDCKFFLYLHRINLTTVVSNHAMKLWYRMPFFFFFTPTE